MNINSCTDWEVVGVSCRRAFQRQRLGFTPGSEAGLASGKPGASKLGHIF